MKKITAILVVSILSASLSGCLLLDKLNKPDRAVSGQQIIDDASTAAAIGYFLGITLKKDIIVASMGQDAFAGATSNAPIAMIVAPMYASVDPKKSYTRESADKCVQGTQYRAMVVGMQVGRALAKEIPSTFSEKCASKPDTKSAVKCATKEAALMAPLGFVMCEAEQAGKVIDTAGIRM